MNRTPIEWVVNPDGSRPGYTWSPVTGCLNHNNGLCKGGGFPCFAYKLAYGRLRSKYLANIEIAPVSDERSLIPLINIERAKADAYNDPFYPRFWWDRIVEMRKRNNRLYYDGKKRLYVITPRGIFVCDMSDLFGIGVPEHWTQKVLDEIWGNKGFDRFYLLTKQHQNLIKWSPFPDWCWVGVTAVGNIAMMETLTSLAKIEAKMKYISIEPMGMPIDPHFVGVMAKVGVGWLIIGAQTKPYKPPEIKWVEEFVKAADNAGIPVFLKNNLEKMCFSLNQSQLDKYTFWDKSYSDKTDGFILGVDLRQELPE